MSSMLLKEEDFDCEEQLERIETRLVRSNCSMGKTRLGKAVCLERKDDKTRKGSMPGKEGQRNSEDKRTRKAICLERKNSCTGYRL